MHMTLTLATHWPQVFKNINNAMSTYTTTQLYNKINELATAKEALRQALIAKGATISTSIKLEDYPNIILNLCK